MDDFLFGFLHFFLLKWLDNHAETMKCFLRLRPFIYDIYTHTWRSIKITVLIVREIRMLHLNHEILLSGKPILKVTISYLTGSFQRNENNLIKGANVFRYHYARDIKRAG